MSDIVEFDLPDGWDIIWNRLYDVDLSDKDVALHEKENHYVGDLLQFEAPSGELIDVGWHPPFDINGKYVCLVLEDDKDECWDNPVEKKKFTKLTDVINWVNTWIKKLSPEEIESIEVCMRCGSTDISHLFDGRLYGRAVPTHIKCNQCGYKGFPFLLDNPEDVEKFKKELMKDPERNKRMQNQINTIPLIKEKEDED